MPIPPYNLKTLPQAPDQNPDLESKPKNTVERLRFINLSTGGNISYSPTGIYLASAAAGR